MVSDRLTGRGGRMSEKRITVFVWTQGATVNMRLKPVRQRLSVVANC